ncbi:MAG: hypothetical protein AAF614_41165 [Chloroflexota bacterium]
MPADRQKNVKRLYKQLKRSESCYNKIIQIGGNVGDCRKRPFFPLPPDFPLLRERLAVLDER